MLARSPERTEDPFKLDHNHDMAAAHLDDGLVLGRRARLGDTSTGFGTQVHRNFQMAPNSRKAVTNGSSTLKIQTSPRAGLPELSNASSYGPSRWRLTRALIPEWQASLLLYQTLVNIT